ncbi:MAG: MFS transporter [Clostridiales bacterium]|nr:MFS transporter [Clostridiales bacterium]
MNIKGNFKLTINACFVGYIVQAIINNFLPLLFLTFQSSYSIPLTKITLLITINFGVQLLVDALAIAFVDKIGYRTSMVLAHGCATVGLICLTILPDMFSDPFVGLLLAVIIYAIGGGLLEVLVSPVMEACPTDNKEKAMSLLHSFYCWGHVGVVLLSTLFFFIFGIANWRMLALFWATIPFFNMIAFTRVPMASLIDEGDSGLSIKELFSNKIFWVILLMMLCAGASEQAVSQWASTFAEKGLNISKTLGDLTGPMTFAILMGLSRLFYGKYGDKINLERFMNLSLMLCIASYLCIVFAPTPAISLLGCTLAGLSVGILWPGTFSIAAASIRRGGTAMFALMALAGDLGCAGGPTVVGMVSDKFDGNLKPGILAAIIFPVLLLLGIMLNKSFRNKGIPDECIDTQSRF